MGNPLGLSINPQAACRASSQHCQSRLLQHTRTVVTRQALLPVKHRVAAIRVLVNLDTGMHEVRAQRTGRDLQMKTVKRHGIVIGNLTLFLDA